MKKTGISPFLWILPLLTLVGCGRDAGQEAARQAAVDSVPAMDAATSTAAPAPDELIDPNAASPDALATVPGMHPELAETLIAGRPYADMREVDAVLAGSLSEEQRNAAYTRLWMPIDLNTASAEEILLIPGIGERMLHEFEEYRPYRGIEEFRREIGKYVDDQEVARLEQYVEVR